VDTVFFHGHERIADAAIGIFTNHKTKDVPHPISARRALKDLQGGDLIM
jgi:hypothetical protein